MNFRKFMRNTKAISPIFATLILIAIAIIAGVVVYAFTSGFLSGSTSGGPVANEKMSIQAAQWEDPNVVIYAQSQSGTITIANVLLKDGGGTVLENIAGTSVTTSPDVTSTLTAFTIPTTVTITPGACTVTIVTSNGNQFVSPSFTVS